MNCNQAREHFFDAMEPGSPVASHVSSCTACAKELASLQSTMTLLDEWTAPAESAYFNTRLQARLAEVRREEEAKAQSWGARLWTPAFLRPALVAAMGLAFVIGMNFYGPVAPVPTKAPAVTAQKGTAVGDLQALDKNQDLYADFDLLDDVGVNHAPASSTPNQGAGSQL